MTGTFLPPPREGGRDRGHAGRGRGASRLKALAQSDGQQMWPPAKPGMCARPPVSSLSGTSGTNTYPKFKLAANREGGVVSSVP